MKREELVVDAIALYGSQARRDADNLSDIDMVVVDADVTALAHAKAALSTRGVSCATYTWRRLQRMSFRGSLFIEHLRREALIIRDNNNSLRSFLEAFRPRGDYLADVDATKRTLALTSRTSDMRASLGWAYDVLAVAVRNLGVLELANRGQYVFAYHDILAALKDDGSISYADAHNLEILRRLKALYRGGHYEQLPGRGVLESMQRTVSRCFKTDFDSKTIHPFALAEDMLVH
ncbi:MAG: nucleotidyltransferase domain-containing protein [Rhodospirillales bacterium]|nr:nucleotidyltransferase domain-containing protein [Rhodospirillales bacterium]